METLGQVLKSTRESVSLSLREVENSTAISNAYLSQLENDKIKKPSASVLYKLADLYKIRLDVLLIAAGIIEKDAISVEPEMTELERQVAFSKGKLEEEEEKQVVSFIKFLLAQSKNGSPGTAAAG